MATASQCGTAVEIKEATASGAGSTAVSAPTVFNYPVQPIDDTGRMMALASIIGGLFDAVLGGDSLDGASEAEDKWKAILDAMQARGEGELANVDSERGFLPVYEADLRAQVTDYRNKADTMWGKLEPVNTNILAEIADQRSKSDDEYDLSDVACLDDAIAKLCEYVGCGYTPDYAGIASRVRADAEVASMKVYQEACRTSNRYAVNRSIHSALEIRTAVHSAALMATAQQREAERINAVKLNHDWRFEHMEKLEKLRMGRRELSLKYDELAMKGLVERWSSFGKMYIDVETNADAISKERWQSHANAAFKSYELGGQMMAAAAQAYQYLAASIRQTAKQGGGGGGVAGALATLAAVIPMFSGSCTPTSIPLLGQFYPRPQQCCSTT